MENTYGIGVANRYALFLDEEEDPLEVLKIQELERESKRKSKNLEKETKVKTAAEPKAKSTPVRKATKENQNAKVASTTEAAKLKDETLKIRVNPKNVKFIGDAREERNNRRNRDDRVPYSGGDVNRDGHRDGPREGKSRGPRTDMTGGLRDGPREGQGRGPRNDMTSGTRDGQSRGPRYDISGEDRRGRGMGPRGIGVRGRGYRGAGGVRGGYDNRFRRDFDRQVGTDKPEPPHTSEVPSNEWVAEPPAPTEVVAVEATTTLAAAEGDNENTTAAEEEPRELTLDEYKALRSSRQKPTYNLRKAGEGEDLTQWNNMYELSKKKEEEEPEEEEAEYDTLEYPQRVGRQKHLLNIDIHFTDTRRGSRGRGGGRGGPRGSRGSGPRGGGASSRTEDGTRTARGGVRGDHQGSGFRGDRFGGERGDRFGGERGDRFGGERGFRGDRAERGDRADFTEAYAVRGTKQSAPKVDDEHDFPSLG